MAENSAISWTDHTWSPWYGCTQVSMGDHGACVGCYARFLSETRQKRVVFGGPGRGDGTRDARADSGWKEPLKWNREAAADNAVPGLDHLDGRRFVFPSMCDPFDNHPDLPPLRRRFFDLIRATPHLTWLLLTKRPGNIVKLFQDTYRDADGYLGIAEEDAASRGWPRNAAIGCTVVTQEEADRDIPKLLAAKAALKPAFAFVSMEPLLGPVDLTEGATDGHTYWNFLTGHSGDECEDGRDRLNLDWVITGGETDQGSHRARPSHPEWFRSLREQCAAAGVPYHHKQNGEWAHSEDQPPPNPGARFFDDEGAPQGDGWHFWAEGDRGANASIKVGKKAAGRLLDGVEHNARPAVSA